MKTEEEVCPKLRRLLMDGVEKRLDADAPVGFLLSGGLDSSLVCAIAQKMLDKPIRTFAFVLRGLHKSPNTSFGYVRCSAVYMLYLTFIIGETG